MTFQDLLQPRAIEMPYKAELWYLNKNPRINTVPEILGWYGRIDLVDNFSGASLSMLNAETAGDQLSKSVYTAVIPSNMITKNIVMRENWSIRIINDANEAIYVDYVLVPLAADKAFENHPEDKVMYAPMQKERCDGCTAFVCSDLPDECGSAPNGVAVTYDEETHGSLCDFLNLSISPGTTVIFPDGDYLELAGCTATTPLIQLVAEQYPHNVNFDNPMNLTGLNAKDFITDF